MTDRDNKGWEAFQNELSSFEQKKNKIHSKMDSLVKGGKKTGHAATRNLRRKAIFAGRAASTILLVVALMFGAGGGILIISATAKSIVYFIGFFMLSLSIMIAIAGGSTLLALGSVKKNTERSDARRTVQRLLDEQEQITDLLLSEELSIPLENVHSSMKKLAIAGVITRDVDENTGCEVYRKRNADFTADEQELADFETRLHLAEVDEPES